MAWKIRMMSGKEYQVGEKDADNARRAQLNGGVAFILNGTTSITGKSIEAVEDEITTNSIFNDENFAGLMDGNGRAIDLLNNRYPLPKYDREWKQALEYKKKIENGEIKLLG
jgi:hypothetical protein